MNAPSRTRFGQAAASGAELLLLWLVTVAAVFRFRGFVHNEVDVLPSARAALSAGFLPNDWYLHQQVPYRGLFNALVGPLVAHLGFKAAAIVGRLVSHFCFAYAVWRLQRGLRIPIALGALAVLVFVHAQSLVALEWMVGGVETKPYAYACVLLALSAFQRERWAAGWLFSGAALSLHILVGLYAAFCAVVALLVTAQRHGEGRRPFLRSTALFLLSGAYGLYASVQQIARSGGPQAQQAWRIYVEYRVAHHVNPGAWEFGIGAVSLIVITLSFLLIFWRTKTRDFSLLVAYGLAGILLFAVGLGVYGIGAIPLLRFYWFRFPDTMLPLLSVLLLARAGSDYLRRDPHPLGGRARLALSGAGLALCIGFVAFKLGSQFQVLRKAGGWGDPKTRPLFEWIAAHTPADAIVLAEPSLQDFYIHANRAMFVSVKHAPQTPMAILEWYHRLQLCNNGVPPHRREMALFKEFNDNYYKLDEAAIRKIAKEYNLTYYIGSPDHPLAFPQVFAMPKYVLYKITN